MEKHIAQIPELKHSLEGWYSAGIRVGDLIFTSGLAGKDRSNGQIHQTVERQIRQIFEDMALILQAHGGDVSNVVKITMYFTNWQRDWPTFDRIRREVFVKDPPCSIGVGVTEIALGAAIAVDAIAAL